MCGYPHYMDNNPNKKMNYEFTCANLAMQDQLKTKAKFLIYVAPFTW